MAELDFDDKTTEELEAIAAKEEKEAQEARDISNNIFNKKTLDNRINSFEIKSNDINKLNFSILDAIEKLDLLKSRSETKRLIKSNGIKVDDIIYNENNFSLEKYSDKKEIKISVGKKKIGILKII